MSATSEGAEAEIARTAAKIRLLDTVPKEVRSAFGVLSSLVKELPDTETFLFAPESVAAWRTLQSHDAETFMVYRENVVRRCGRITAGLLDMRIGPPRALGSANALPGFTLTDLWAGYEPPPYLVRDFLVPAGLTVLVGQSGHLKSQIALELSLAAATGGEFHGKRANRTGVLYVAGEGHSGIKKRLRAWALSRGLDATAEQPALLVTSQGANLMTNPEQLRATVANAAEQLGLPIGLIVIDTLAANFGPGDENKASDMSLALASVREAAPDAASLVVHHTGHEGARERGSYALIASADYRILAKYDDVSKVLDVKWNKAKDDELPAPMAFMRRIVPLGWIDSDGEELRSIVLEQTDAMPPGDDAPGERSASSGMGENQTTVLKTLQRLYRENRKNVQEQGRPATDARIFLTGLRAAVVDARRMDRKRYAEALSGLTKRGSVVIEDTFIYLADDPARASET